MSRAAVLLALAILAFSPHALQAQRMSAGAGVGIGSNTWRADLHGQLAVPVASRLQLAAGLRLTRYGGTARNFERQGPADGELPAELTLDPDVWGLNLMVGLEARVLGPLSAGANLDVLGFAAGSSSTQGGIDIRPARFSMFRYGNADRGSLNSEFYLAAQLSPRFAIRGGLSHFVVGYEAEQEDHERRYLRFDDAVFVALRWRPGAR